MRRPQSEAAIRFVTRLLVAAYLIEAGLLLMIAPWTALWERNFFTAAHVGFQAIVTNPFVRGGVTGVGFITVLCGLWDLATAFLAHGRLKTQPPAPTSHVP